MILDKFVDKAATWAANVWEHASGNCFIASDLGTRIFVLFGGLHAMAIYEPVAKTGDG